MFLHSGNRPLLGLLTLNPTGIEKVKIAVLFEKYHMILDIISTYYIYKPFCQMQLLVLLAKDTNFSMV